jgi:hypothetical protein
VDTDELNQLIRSLNRGAADPREAAEPELELVRPEETVPALDLDASAAHTAEDEVSPRVSPKRCAAAGRISSSCPAPRRSCA